jgi:hypothetical protein
LYLSSARGKYQVARKKSDLDIARLTEELAVMGEEPMRLKEKLNQAVNQLADERANFWTELENAMASSVRCVFFLITTQILLS